MLKLDETKKEMKNDLLQELKWLLLDVEDAISYIECNNAFDGEMYCQIISDRGKNVDAYRRGLFVDDEGEEE